MAPAPWIFEPRWVPLAVEWATVAEFAVAAGTLVLALVTLGMVIAARKGVELQGRQFVAAQRPYVVPLVSEAWLTRAKSGEQLVHVKNAGAGPAFNIGGSIYWSGGAGGSAAVLPPALAVGDEAWPRLRAEGIEVIWGAAAGFLRYVDSAGTEWQTHFRFGGDYFVTVGGSLVVDVIYSGTTEDLGEPQYNSEQGWINAPAAVRDR